MCDGLDNNCDGEVDENLLTDYFKDADDDGFGDQKRSNKDASNPRERQRWVQTVMMTTPQPTQVRKKSAMKSTTIAMAISMNLQTDWWIDEDGDGFGDPDYYAEGCLEGDGYAANDQDCDDTSAEIHPDMEEVCDEVDNNCDGDIDENLLMTVYLDTDEDGFGDDDQPVSVCEVQEGFAVIGGDCDDIDSSAFPGGIEVCDDVDNDCDGLVDDGVGSPGTVWYYDAMAVLWGWQHH